jgi:hypothetical protein
MEIKGKPSHLILIFPFLFAVGLFFGYTSSSIYSVIMSWVFFSTSMILSLTIKRKQNKGENKKWQSLKEQ